MEEHPLSAHGALIVTQVQPGQTIYGYHDSTRTCFGKFEVKKIFPRDTEKGFFPPLYIIEGTFTSYTPETDTWGEKVWRNFQDFACNWGLEKTPTGEWSGKYSVSEATFKRSP